MAWLHAVPDKLKRSRLAEAQAYAEARGEALEIELPAASADYLRDYLFEVGPFMQGGMAPAPLTFQEMDAWVERTGREIEPWESILLRRMSQAYLDELQAATSPDRPPPWMADPGAKVRETAGDKVERLFDRRAV